MNTAITKSRLIAWALAALVVFVVVTLLGSKIFYGVVVPQVQTVNNLGILIILGFAFLAGVAAFFALSASPLFFLYLKRKYYLK